MIRQARFSRGVNLFESGFLKRWRLDNYHDVNAPCYFAGVYSIEDVNVINAHRGLKIIWNPGHVRPFFRLIRNDNVVIHRATDGIDLSMLSDYRIVNAKFEIKDLSAFKPNKLGNKIYTYLGREKLKEIYGLKEVDELKKRCKFEVITAYQGHDMEWVKRNYYDQCFVYFKPCITGGGTSAIELALMGRKSISNSNENMYIPYKDMDEVIDIINRESEKIGTVQPNCLPEGTYYTGVEWLNEKFWL